MSPTSYWQSELNFKYYTYPVLDRSNLGNARLQGLPEDTLHGDPTGVLFDWVTSAFYFSYVRKMLVNRELISDSIRPRFFVRCRRQ